MKLTEQIRENLQKLAPTQLHLHDLFKQAGIDISYKTVGKLIGKVSDDEGVNGESLDKAFALLGEPNIPFRIKPVPRRKSGRKPKAED